jgi:hypothetical protein
LHARGTRNSRREKRPRNSAEWRREREREWELPVAEDGFDPNVLLDPATGKVVYKTHEQKTATKTRPTGPPGMLRIYTDGSALKNGRDSAAAGVGVFFGPGDTRFVFSILYNFSQ